MKKIVLLLLLFCRSLQAQTPGLINSIGFYTSDGNTFDSSTFGTINTTGANFVAVALVEAATGTATVSDNFSNSYALACSLVDPSGSSRRVSMWRAVNLDSSHVGSGHFWTVTCTGCFAAAMAQAWSNMAAAPDDNTSTGSDTDGTITLGTLTPSVASNVLITAVGRYLASSIDSSFTTAPLPFIDFAGNNFGIAMAYKVQATATSAAPTWTMAALTNTNFACMADFKGVTAAPAGPKPGTLVTLGAGR